MTEVPLDPLVKPTRLGISTHVGQQPVAETRVRYSATSVVVTPRAIITGPGKVPCESCHVQDRQCMCRHCPIRSAKGA